jgi:photosystem II stability/assembly factor-like uncharacterized protein
LHTSHTLLAAALAVALAGTAAAQNAFQAPLATPSAPSSLAQRSALHTLARAGDRLVAAGQRGHILYSDDGLRWTQAAVPVSSDLLALHFPRPRQGWAVGHDGVVLHSADAGATWAKQLDGRQAGALLVQYYGKQVREGVPDAARWLKEAETFAAQGADKPLLDVWFEDELHGFIVGAFNLVLRTTDGGRTWEPWLHRTDNPQAFHLYAVRPAGGEVFVAGEQGLVLKLDRAAGRLRAVNVPYRGTFFGLAGTAKEVVAFGLRGNAWRSADGGASWQKLDTGVASALTGGAVRADGSLVLVSQAGDVLVGSAGGAALRRLKLERQAPAHAIVEAAPGRLAIAGARGVRIETPH